MKKSALLFTWLCAAFSAFASTSVTTSSVSGHWTLSGSPYLIFNDITINAAQTLTIDPGVEVVFQGAYSLNIIGFIKAAGTAAQPISFHMQDTTGWSFDTSAAGGWAGIQVQSLSSGIIDLSVIAWCNIYDMKNNAFITWRPLTLSNCSFYHNSLPNSTSGLSGIINVGNLWSDSTLLFEMDSCNVYGNYLGLGLNTINNAYGIFHMSHSQVHDNYDDDAINLQSASVLLTDNEIYNNQQRDNLITGVSALVLTSCYGVISGNKIYGNTSVFDGAVYCAQSTLDINSNFICNNNATSTMARCGVGDGAGGLRVSSLGVVAANPYIIRNNIIANNFTFAWGGGLEVYMSGATISNNTIVNNIANYGGGIYVFSNPSVCGMTTLKIKNNILYDNINSGYWLDSTNCNFWSGGNIEYANNFTQRPYYQDVVSAGGFTYAGDSATNIIGPVPGLISIPSSAGLSASVLSSNFALLPTSVCIDKGDTAGVYPMATDYAGNPRIMGSAIDLGAYEFNPASLSAPVQHAASGSIKLYPNPAVSMVFINTPQGKGTLELRDMNGNLAMVKKVINTLTLFDISVLPRGIYFASWNDANGTNTTEKLVIE